ncbi:MAG: ribonuclease H family protein [Bacteroidaceae bacterium]|nr:ribonuclease H [Bacteroidales bacterium]MBQ3152226.1 ribonuclease H family protein [Bacteroidaceae bacterium]MBR6806059.1 ribonuclease H family protein [Bacteroidaceae bacterium]
MGKKRYYVVWKGLVPGVYDTWDECRIQIEGVKQALYKSFATLAEAERAYSEAPHKYIYAKKEEKPATAIPVTVHRNALAVDAACSGNPGQMEYRGVYLATGEEIFHFGPILGTNNIGEFLAIVHGLALLEKQQSNIPIYSDSRNALLWIKQKKCKTKLERTPATEEVFNMIDRAEKWLNSHTYSSPLIKWETSEWGEIPADFGRK